MRRIKSVVPLKLLKNKPLRIDNGDNRLCLNIRQRSSEATTVKPALPRTDRQLS
jgi:hypothetical protein